MYRKRKLTVDISEVILLFKFNCILFCYPDQMIRNGNVELQAREEELRFMRMQINEEKRTVTVLHGQTPNKMSLEQELVTLQIQVLDDTQSNTHHIHVHLNQ